MIIKKNLQNAKKICKVICFYIIGLGIFFMCEKVLTYKYYWPIDSAYITKSIKGMYRENENIDVLAVGTSHIMDAFVPLELYENYEIISYNAATYGQPINMSYYLLKEAVKTNEIKIFIYDIGSLFSKQESWEPIMDAAPLNCNKIEMALEICAKKEGVTFGEVMFPILRQHERWKDLNKADFEIYEQTPLYSKGYSLFTDMSGAQHTVEDMNEVVNYLQKSKPLGYEFSNGEYKNTDEDITEPVVVNEDNMKWFIKMRDLCKEKGIIFLCTKIPCVYQPELYNSAWTLEKSNLVKEICVANNISFVDMLYDIDLSIDFSTDYVDGGIHLNHLGAQKVTDYLGKYLTEHYTLSKRKNTKWDRDLKLYKEVCQLALLQLDCDFSSYINRITNQFRNKVILIAVSNDMAACLNEDDIQLLQAMGLKSDFKNKICYSYIAFIDHGKVKYEKLSNRKIEYSGTCGEMSFYLESSGYYSGAKASIIINDTEYAINGQGMNIVVYDNEKNLLYDSVRFDTSFETHYVERATARTKNVRKLEEYLMESE